MEDSKQPRDDQVTSESNLIKDENLNPALDDSSKEAERLDSALGCVIGAFIGDALGSAVEFQREVTPEDMARCLRMRGGVFGNGPGQVTDDSELAMCLIHGLSSYLPHFSLEQIAAHYRSWIISRPFDIGQTTSNALSGLPKRSSNFAAAAIMNSKNHNSLSQSNGSFMRSSPLAVYCRNLSIDDLQTVVESDVSLTHSNLVVKQAETYYIACMSHLIQNPGDREGALNIVNQYLDRCCEDVKNWVRDTHSDQPIRGNPNMGYVKIAFEHSFRQLQKDQRDFEMAMKEVIGLAGDTDTNAAIVGAMVGAYVGYSRLPREWVDKVENFDCKVVGGIERYAEGFGGVNCLDQKLVKNLVIEIFKKAPKVLTCLAY